MKAELPLKFLTGFRAKNEEDIQQMIVDSETAREIDEEFIDLHKCSKTLYENSEFYKHFWKKHAYIRDLLDIDPKAKVTNKYYGVVHDEKGNEIYDFGAYFLKTFLSSAPITTGIILHLIDNNISRVSNAYSETHGKTYQNNVLPSKHNNTLTEATRALINHNECLAAEHKLNICSKDSLLIQEKPHYPDAATNPYQIEKWGRTRKDIEALEVKKKTIQCLHGTSTYKHWHENR